MNEKTRSKISDETKLINQKRSSGSSLITLFLASLKITYRNRQLLFWSFMFPLMFTFIFGFFFGKGSTSTGTIAFINQSKSPIAQNLETTMGKSDLFKLRKDLNVNDAKDLMKQGKIANIVIISKDFGELSPTTSTKIKIIDDPANLQANSVVMGFIREYLNQVNFQVANAKPIYSVAEEKTTTQALNYFDFVLIGLIGMALMNSSVQGIAIGMAQYREDKILKRLTTTPLPSWEFIVAQVLSRLVINIAQIGLILAIGKYFFDAHIYGNIFLIFLLAMLGAVLFQLLGFVIAGFAKTTQAAEGMATTATIPMMFLAGVFFPIDQLPKWLFSVVQYLPLAPLLRIIRGTALESTSIWINPINIIIVTAWIVLLLILASYKFRLSDE